MASFLFLNWSYFIVYVWPTSVYLWLHLCQSILHPVTSTTSICDRKSNRSWWDWRRLRREIQMTGVTDLLKACGNESGLFRPPFALSNPQQLPPNLACHFSPWPLQKITLGSLQGPTKDHVNFAFIAVRMKVGGLNAEDWQLFEGVEGKGCEGGQCHTKGGQEGKISHPWRLWNLVHPSLLSHGLQTCLSVRGQSHKDKQMKL